MLLRTAVLVACLSSWLVVSGLGCQSYQKPAFNHGKGANGATTLIVPFRESRNHRWYGESETGVEVARMLKAWAEENGLDAVIAQGDDVDQVLRNLRDVWSEDEVKADDWPTLVSGLGVEYVVEGDLGELRLRKPRTVGIYDAELPIQYRVINCTTGKIAYIGSVIGTYAGGSEGHDTILMTHPSGETDRVVKHHVMRDLAQRIGKDLYGYGGE